MKHDASIVVPDSLQRIPHCHVDCGLGGAANGLNRATARFGGLIEKVACSGIIDVPLAPHDEPEGHMGTVISFAMHQPPPVYARNSGIYPTLHAMGDNELMRSAPKTVTSIEKLWLVRPFAPLPTQRAQSESSRRDGEWHKATRAAQQETNNAKVHLRPREG